MTVLFIGIVAVVLLGLLAFCKESGYWSKKEQQGQQEQKQKAQQASPCETCLRWGECNGIDNQCPHRKESGKNEQY